MSELDPHAAFVALEREIGLLLRRARAISSRLAGQLHPDLDGAAFGLLALLQDAGPLRASDLVARLGLDKSTVSRQVASLVGLGLVDRSADPDDGRAQVLTPSAEDPKVLTVDLEGVLAQLLWLGLDHKGRTATGGSASKKAAPFGAADLQSKLVAGAGFEPAAFRL